MKNNVYSKNFKTRKSGYRRFLHGSDDITPTVVEVLAMVTKEVVLIMVMVTMEVVVTTIKKYTETILITEGAYIEEDTVPTVMPTNPDSLRIASAICRPFSVPYAGGRYYPRPVRVLTVVEGMRRALCLNTLKSQIASILISLV